MSLRVVMGCDDERRQACQVAAFSLRATASDLVKLHYINHATLAAKGLYTRTAAAGLASSHEFARFFVPSEFGHQGWALFTDGRVLFREDVAALFALADSERAVLLVKHQTPDGVLAPVASSVMLWNCAHPAHRKHLTYAALNERPLEDLQRFFWLREDQIGELPATWNWLVTPARRAARGAQPNLDPALVQFTPNPALVQFIDGVPSNPGFAVQPFADEWRMTARYCVGNQPVRA